MKKEQKLKHGQRLKNIRNILGYSQRQMAEEFRVVHGAIGLWESGQRPIPGPVLLLLDLYEKELGLAPDAEENFSNNFEKLRSTWISRNMFASTQTARMVGQVTWQSLKDVFSQNAGVKDIKRRAQEAMALQMVEVLGQLKGLPMKIGQMVSYMDFNSPELKQENFCLLQNLSTPMKPSLLAEVIVKDFMKTPSQLFKKWDETPFSAASIGQVHHAQLHTGEEVAVKIQYPDIHKTIETDFKNAEVIDRIGSLVFKEQLAGIWIGELKERLMGECDYKQEAAHQELFFKVYENHPHIIVPRVFKETSSDHVITTQFIEGKNFDKYNKTTSSDEKNKIAQIIWDFSFETPLRHGFFHADPHPGNFLFKEGQVAVLDYGCVKHLSPEFIKSWKELLTALRDGDDQKAEEILIAMGVAPKPEKFDFPYHLQALKAWYEPWLSEREFQFSPEVVISLWNKMVVNNPNKVSINIPKDWILLNHLHWGTYALMAHLGAKSHWGKNIRTFFKELL